MKHYFIYEAAAGDGTGGPSLADLDDPNYKPPIQTGIESGDGGKTPEDIAKAAAEQKAAEEVKKQQAPVEGLNADGSVAEGYELKDGKPVKKEETGDGDITDEEDDTTDSAAFFESVEQITGKKIEVEYGETDPLSPEGVAMREGAVRDNAVVEFEAFLRASDPRSYSYLLHRSAGGTDAEFFNQDALILPPEEDFKDSVELQTSILRKDLLDKGVPEDVVDATITKYIKDNKLAEQAGVAYKGIKEAQKKQAEDIERLTQEKQEELNGKVTNVHNILAKSIADNLLSIVVPEAKKVEFNNFVKNNLRYDDGKFYVVAELGNQNIKEVLESQYFQFVKGNLKAIVQKEANTKATQRLRLNANKAKAGDTKTINTDKPTPDFVSLGDL